MTHSFFNSLANRLLFQGYLSKKDGHEIKEASFHVRLLKKEDALKMFALSQKIYSSLKPEEKTFIHKHEDISYYKNITDDRSMAYMGVFHKGTLIGMSYIKICADLQTFSNEIPNQTSQAFDDNSFVATFGGDCVLPAYRGNKLNQIMVRIRKELAQKIGCQEAYAIIDRNNINNLTPYFANHFSLISSGIDPTDNGPIYTMQIGLKRSNTGRIRTPSQFTFASVKDKERIDNLLAQNFQGVRYDTLCQMMEFVRKPTLIHTQKRVLVTHPQQRKDLQYV